MSLDHVVKYFNETAKIAALLDYQMIEQMAQRLAYRRDKRGRLFIAGLGGSAANASHAANDFRKLAMLDAISLSDQTAELTARANDEGWETIYEGMLRASVADSGDALMVLSVGGGSDFVSTPLVNAMRYAKQIGMECFAIVGRDGGHAKYLATHCLIIPTVSPDRVTPHTEAFQSVVLHALVSHPDLQLNPTKWTS